MTYLIIHFLEKPEDFNFENPIEASIKEKAGAEDLILTADNFSDSYLIQQYVKEIKGSNELRVICHFASPDVELGAGLSLLNSMIRKENVRLEVNLEHPKMRPFMLKLNGKILPM